MVRSYKRKTERGLVDEETMREAVMAVQKKEMSVRGAAQHYNIKNTTLQRYVKKFINIKLEENEDESGLMFKPNYGINKIFTPEEENDLKNYLTQASAMHHGLPPKEARKLAYEFAVGLLKNDKIPPSWERNKCAGEDWLSGFIKRCKTISLRKPEATSLARAMGFNKPVIDKFYKTLQELLVKHKFGPENIYNLDETGLTSVQTPGKVLASKGIKQIGQVTSAERGQLVTLCCTINAIGNAIPPFFVFPRVKFRGSMLNGAPLGSGGSATSSGWMNTDTFLMVMNHFIKYSKSSPGNKTLLIYDNHESHVSIAVIKLAKENGVILLTLPPHCSHKIQPLDKTVFGPLKRYYNEACRNWLTNHPGRRISIYEIAGLVGQAFPFAFSTNNILSGFSKVGIYPFNSSIFTEEDFAAASVTDLQQPEPPANPSTTDKTTTTDTTTSTEDSKRTTEEYQPIPCCSTSIVQSPPNTNVNVTSRMTPEMVRPFPKASERSTKVTKRKIVKSEVLTDTPVKNRIEMETLERENNPKKSKINDKTKNKSVKQRPKSQTPVRKKLFQELTSSEEEEWVESSDSDLQAEFSEEETEGSDDDNGLSIKANIGDFLLIEVCGKKKGNANHFVAEVMEVEEGGYEVKYMKRLSPSYNFVFESEELYFALSTDVVKKLPTPSVHAGTERTLQKLSFKVNLTKYNVH